MFTIHIKRNVAARIKPVKRYCIIRGKSDTIRTELTEYARTQWKLGINSVLLGHYHQTGIIEEDGNSVIFMGDWLRHFTVTRLDEKGWWQGNWEEI